MLSAKFAYVSALSPTAQGVLCLLMTHYCSKPSQNVKNLDPDWQSPTPSALGDSSGCPYPSCYLEVMRLHCIKCALNAHHVEYTFGVCNTFSSLHHHYIVPGGFGWGTLQSMRMICKMYLYRVVLLARCLPVAELRSSKARTSSVYSRPPINHASRHGLKRLMVETFLFCCLGGHSCIR